jgi:hypothetical protein
MPMILSYHPHIEVGNKKITGNLNDYYTNDEIWSRAQTQYLFKDIRDMLKSLPIELDGMGLLFLDSDIADEYSNKTAS